MNRSLVSLLTILGSLFVACFVTWLYLHGKALSKPVKTPFDHPFIRLAHRGDKRVLFLRVSTPQDADSVLNSKFENAGAWLDVRLGGENQLIVSPAELLPNGKQKGKPVEISTRTECEEAGLLKLEDFVEKLRGRPVILNLISRRPGLSNAVQQIWGPGKPFSVETVAMQSESDGTLKELREAAPRGFYGSSQATLIQMEILSNLDLEGLMDLKADMLVSSTEEQQHGKMIPRIREATLLEAHRRGLKRYAGPTRSKESAESLFKLGYDGVLIEDREIFESF